MPALKLNAENLWEVTEATAFITNKAMSRARFLEVMRGALVQVGVDFTQAQSATYNKLRRFLPTMPNVMELPDLDLQSVGNWTELPSGGGRDPSSKKPKGSMPMGSTMPVPASSDPSRSSRGASTDCLPSTRRRGRN